MSRGWQIASARALPISDRLAHLEATAPDKNRAARARALGDTIRSATTQINTLVTTNDLEAARRGLSRVHAELETALASLAPNTPPAGSAGPSA
jgi:hypothetical protein